MALAEQAQSAIDAISHNANEINQLVHDISLALKEQTVASQDVARNVEQVAQLSEENSRGGDANRRCDSAPQKPWPASWIRQCIVSGFDVTHTPCLTCWLGKGHRTAQHL